MAATYYVDQRLPIADDHNDGSASSPWKTIRRAAVAAHAGDTVVIATGVYREAIKITRSGTSDQPIRFTAAPAATVVITGADRITNWSREPGEGNVFGTSWGYDFITWNPAHTHPNDDYHLLIGRCEQVFVGGQALRQVLDRRQLARGTFYVDFRAKRLYAWSADNGNLSDETLIVEASTRPLTWECTGDYVETVGLQFRYSANLAEHGAATFSGRYDRVEDCSFEQTNSVGAMFQNQDITVRHCAFKNNGQLGFSAVRAHQLHIFDCTISGNNTKGFSREWEAGGDKLVLCRGAVIEHSTFADNHGLGIWFDIGNEDCIVRNCLIVDNEDAGLFDEISHGLHASDNVIVGNGLADTRGQWGASAGISLSSSPNSVIERNLLIGNKEGFSFREAPRTAPRINAAPGSPEEKIWNHDEQVHHNTLAYNRDAQVWGWFDVEDERQWPVAMQEHPPREFSLESLKLDLADNLYAIHPGQSLLHWGTPWKRNKAYGTLEEVRKDLHFESSGSAAEFIFQNYAERDFHVPSDSPAIKLDCYPRGEVPGVKLGTVAR